MPLLRSDLVEDNSLRGRAFAEAWTTRVESWLGGLFADAAGVPGTDAGGVALVALGGQGRRELAPQSDLDLLLVYDKGDVPKDIADALWYPIWDEGLKLGHAVRSLRDTLSLASTDLATATSLLSARHICGDEALSVELAERARANWRKHGRRWLGELATSVAERHLVAGDVAFALEPELKEGRGGLRDVHALSWALAAGATVDKHLRMDLGVDHDALFDVRVELHRQTGRPGDTLTLADQDLIAVTFGEPNADALMARVAQAGWRIAQTSDEAWYDIVLRGESTSRVARGVRRLVDRGPDERYMGDACIRDGRVTLVDEMRPPSDAFAMLEVATVAARERKRISYTTLNALVGAPPPPEVWPPEAREVFVELLLCGHAAVEVIEVLELRGLWTRLIPQWRPSVCRPQRNAYHRFTVDRHLLETAAEAAELAHQVEHPEVLMTAALLHDIGKAYPELGDHSECGASIAADIARHMGFGPDEVETIAVLVRHHLLLADTATRRDPDDPATARFVAERLAGDGSEDDAATGGRGPLDGPKVIERVALLSALTKADSLATGPAAISTWRFELIDRLARQTVLAVEAADSSRTAESTRSTESTGKASSSRKTKSSRKAKSSKKSGPRDGPVEKTVGTGTSGEGRSFPDAAQDELLSGVGVLVDADGDRLSVAHDDLGGSFCRLAGVLALHGVDVLSANVFSAGGRVVEEFTVRVGPTGAVAWERVTDDVTKALGGRLAVRSRLAERARTQQREHHPGERQFAPAVRFDNETTTDTTVVEVVGPDSIGLLYRLTRALGEFDLEIKGARIHTMGVDVVDSFFVTLPDGNRLESVEVQEELSRALLEELDAVQGH